MKKGMILFDMIKIAIFIIILASPSIIFPQSNGPVSRYQTHHPGALIQEIDSIYHWKFNSGWTINSKDIDIEYDASNNLTSFLTQQWDGSTWRNYKQYTAIFDGNDNLISKLEQIWQSSNTLENYRQYLYAYDVNNNRTNEIEQVWINYAWQNYRQYSASYDANNNRLWEKWQGWNGYEWANDYQYFWTYDASNNRIIGLRQYMCGSTWMNDSKNIYDYNDNNLVSEFDQGWIDSTWKDQGRSFYTYDSNNNPVNRLDQWLMDTVWVNTSQSLYVYDAANNFLSELAQVWNGIDFYNSWQNLFAYDADNFIKSNSEKYWIYPEDGSPVYIQGDSTCNFYHTLITGTSGLYEANSITYPNPCKGKLSISSSNPISAIEIYNLTGSRIYADYNFKQQTSNEIDLTGYPKGVYVLKIYFGTKFISKKVIVQ